jgi:hypothetical protein
VTFVDGRAPAYIVLGDLSAIYLKMFHYAVDRQFLIQAGHKQRFTRRKVTHIHPYLNTIRADVD